MNTKEYFVIGDEYYREDEEYGRRIQINKNRLLGKYKAKSPLDAYKKAVKDYDSSSIVNVIVYELYNATSALQLTGSSHAYFGHICNEDYSITIPAKKFLQNPPDSLLRGLSEIVQEDLPTIKIDLKGYTGSIRDIIEAFEDNIPSEEDYIMDDLLYNTDKPTLQYINANESHQRELKQIALENGL